MRVLVLHPPLTVGPDFIDDPALCDLGAVQLAAALRPSFDVRLVDAFAAPGAGVEAVAGGLRLGPSPEGLVRAVRAALPFDAALVALTPFHRPPRRDAALGEACAAVRAAAPGVPLVLADCYQSGQHHVDVPGEAVLASYPEADAWVKYEAEATVPALLSALAERGARPAGTYRGAEVDLASLPPPAWELVDLEARDAFLRAFVARVGRRAWPFPLDGRTLPAVTSRGCPYRCLHCSSNPGLAPGAAKRQRRAPPGAIRAAFAALAGRHGATRITVLDELANADPAHLDALLAAAEAERIRLEFPNGLRADLLRTDQLGRLRGRITTLSVSAESGVQRVVDEVVGKALDLAHVERVAAEARAAGLPLLVHYIIGLPGESAAEVNATLRHAVDLHERLGAVPAVQYATPLPGTPLAARAPPPDVQDFGPCFQASPCAAGGEVPPERLATFGWALGRRLEGGEEPEKLIVNLTYRCNNQCVFCAVGNRARADGDEARQRAALERHRRAGVRLVDFDGGEPTLSPALLPLVAHAAALGYERIAVTTNGRRLSYPSFARRLARSGLTTVLVSLHGDDAETHGALVGDPDAFGQTVAGLRNLVRHGGDLELGVNTTIARGNADRLERLAALAYGLGVRWMNFQFLTPFGRATRAHAPDLAAAAAAVGRVIDAWHPRLRIQVVNLPFCMLPGRERLLSPDLGKMRRRMSFVNDEEVNLAEYLAARRVRRPECAPCPYAICCGGFFELEDVPEPPWLGSAAAAATGTSSPSPKRAT